MHLALVARGNACAVRELRLQNAASEGLAEGAALGHLRMLSEEELRKLPVHGAMTIFMSSGQKDFFDTLKYGQ